MFQERPLIARITVERDQPSRMSRSPVSLMCRVPTISQRGSSLNPEPMALFPSCERLVLMIRTPIGELGRSQVQMAAGPAQALVTNPKRSWLESRKPMPRPIPDSKYEALRDKLKVAIH